MSFDNWRTRLRIYQENSTVAARRAAIAPLKINFSQPGPDDEGYYRKPVTEKKLGADGKSNGQNTVIGWTPVAYFMHEGNLVGTVGAQGRSRMMKPEELESEDLWSYVVANPIPWDWYDAVVNKGLDWPDAAKPLEQAAPAAVVEPVVERGIGDNKPPEVEPHIEHGEAIDNAVRAAQDLKVTDEASAAVLMGAKNRIAELRLAADKAGHAIYDPIYADYKAKQAPWPAMVTKASAMEKALNTRYLTWREAERQKAALAAAEAARIQREAEERNARAADRAIASGEPEAAPEIPAVSPAPTPPPAPVTPTYRAHGQRATPKEVEKWHLDGIDDYAKVYEFFKDNADVKAALLKVTTAAITNGQEVPGARRHFGLI